MGHLRSFARRVLESTALAARAHLVARRGRRGRLLVLAYHNVIADRYDAGADLSLHLPLARFIAQVDALSETHRVVPLDAALSEDTDRAGAFPEVAITFDDAYAGTIAHAVPVLAERQIPATIFVPPGRLGGQSFWWDEYSVAPESAARRFRAAALTEGGRSDDVAAIADRADVDRGAVPEAARSARAEDLDAAVASHPGLTVGSHSWSHPNLVACSAADLETELEESRAWLAGRYGPRALPVVSYPYGLADGRVERAARTAGYRWGMRIEGGWVARPGPPLRVPRLNVPAGITPAGFRLRIDGVRGG